MSWILSLLEVLSYLTQTAVMEPKENIGLVISEARLWGKGFTF